VYEDRTVALGLLGDVQHQLLRNRLLIDASVQDPSKGSFTMSTDKAEESTLRPPPDSPIEGAFWWCRYVGA